MSNKTRLQTNNNNLQSILDTVNSLPSGGSGSGGSANVETCSVTNLYTLTVFATTYKNGTFSVICTDGLKIENVVVGSIMFVIGLSRDLELENATLVYNGGSNLAVSIDGSDACIS